MKKILISACLLGKKTRYDAVEIPVTDPLIKQWEQEHRLVPICPEVDGGLPVPRPPAEIVGGTGADVLAGRARVVDCNGMDVTRAFVKGAKAALDLAQEHGITLALLKETSPSCGGMRHYDGSFSGTRRSGQGVLAALLTRNGIRVFPETRTRDLEYLAKGSPGAEQDKKGKDEP